MIVGTFTSGLSTVVDTSNSSPPRNLSPDANRVVILPDTQEMPDAEVIRLYSSL